MPDVICYKNSIEKDNNLCKMHKCWTCSLECNKRKKEIIENEIRTAN